jgi:hypothetical protein
MTMPPHLFRGALAEALLKRSGRIDHPAPAPSTAEDFGTFEERLKAAPKGVDEEDQAMTVGRWLAHCIAREHPEVTRTILLTRMSSRREGQALTGTRSAFSACLRERQVLQVHRLSLRAVLAEAYYHRTLEAPTD